MSDFTTIAAGMTSEIITPVVLAAAAAAAGVGAVGAGVGMFTAWHRRRIHDNHINHIRDAANLRFRTFRNAHPNVADVDTAIGNIVALRVANELEAAYLALLQTFRNNLLEQQNTAHEPEPAKETNPSKKVRGG